jgi:hypothetical protein
VNNSSLVTPAMAGAAVGVSLFGVYYYMNYYKTADGANNKDGNGAGIPKETQAAVTGSFSSQRKEKISTGNFKIYTIF